MKDFIFNNQSIRQTHKDIKFFFFFSEPYPGPGLGGARISAEACPDTLSLSTADKSNCSRQCTMLTQNFPITKHGTTWRKDKIFTFCSEMKLYNGDCYKNKNVSYTLKSKML